MKTNFDDDGLNTSGVRGELHELREALEDIDVYLPAGLDIGKVGIENFLLILTVAAKNAGERRSIGEVTAAPNPGPIMMGFGPPRREDVAATVKAMVATAPRTMRMRGCADLIEVPIGHS